MKNTSLSLWENKYYQISPKDCLDLSFEQSFDMLEQIPGEDEFKAVFDIGCFYPSPVLKCNDTSWAKTAKIIGMNPRILKTYWGIIKYAMTFPENAVHIMPLWETGDGSLYVQNSWNLNPDFLDNNLVKLGFETCEQQLKLTVNILHALGKIVGFDALPHVDNFSEIAILNPKLFEWVKLNEEKTKQVLDVDYNLIYKDVESIIVEYIKGDNTLFDIDEKQRKAIIFPANIDRFSLRMELREVIRKQGYEPLPVVEHYPMRPVLFDKIETSKKDDWAVFKVANKAQHAKIIGSVTPYKFYKIDRDGYPVKKALEKDTWNYFIEKLYKFQKEYNFDFLRADMAHNQISHSHNEPQKEECPNEIWKEVKKKIQKQKSYFATFAEAFYNTYYVEGPYDMENKDFDIVLGNMNFKQIDENYFNWVNDFIYPFRENFNFNPSMTIFTNDGDLIEHNKYFSLNKNNKIRFFISLFLNLPSYMGIGFEVREIEPKFQQEFSNQYVKKQNEDYLFGSNIELFEFISLLRSFYIEYKEIIDSFELDLIETDDRATFMWTYSKEDKIKLLFVVNLNESLNFDISNDFIQKYSNECCCIFETK